MEVPSEEMHSFIARARLYKSTRSNVCSKGDILIPVPILKMLNMKPPKRNPYRWSQPLLVALKFATKEERKAYRVFDRSNMRKRKPKDAPDAQLQEFILKTFSTWFTKQEVRDAYLKSTGKPLASGRIIGKTGRSFTGWQGEFLDYCLKDMLEKRDLISQKNLKGEVVFHVVNDEDTKP